MKQRKPWTEEQDQVLRHLKEVLMERKWSQIAKRMQDEYSMSGRSGKQCRQRYHNHLDSSIKHSEWTQQQEQTLISLHDQVGNRWSVIANQLSGRTDNCVKNHFYSKLRKSIRRLNRVIGDLFKKQFREIKTALLYKVIETSQAKFKVSSLIDEEVIEFCSQLKNKLYFLDERFPDKDQQLRKSQEKDTKSMDQDQIAGMKQLIEDIYEFDKTEKRTNFRPRKSSGWSKDLLYPNMYIKRTSSNCEADFDDDSQQSPEKSESYMSSSFNDDSSSYISNSKSLSKSCRLESKNSLQNPKNSSSFLTQNTSGMRLTRSRSVRGHGDQQSLKSPCFSSSEEQDFLRFSGGIIDCSGPSEDGDRQMDLQQGAEKKQEIFLDSRKNLESTNGQSVKGNKNSRQKMGASQLNQDNNSEGNVIHQKTFKNSSYPSMNQGNRIELSNLKRAQHCIPPNTNSSTLIGRTNVTESILFEEGIVQERSSCSNKQSNRSNSLNNSFNLSNKSFNNRQNNKMFFEDSHFEMRIFSPKNFKEKSNEDLLPITPAEDLFRNYGFESQSNFLFGQFQGEKFITPRQRPQMEEESHSHSYNSQSQKCLRQEMEIQLSSVHTIEINDNDCQNQSQTGNEVLKQQSRKKSNSGRSIKRKLSLGSDGQQQPFDHYQNNMSPCLSIQRDLQMLQIRGINKEEQKFSFDNNDGDYDDRQRSLDG